MLDNPRDGDQVPVLSKQFSFGQGGVQGRRAPARLVEWYVNIKNILFGIAFDALHGHACKWKKEVPSSDKTLTCSRAP